jgi:hypothetical protein
MLFCNVSNTIAKNDKALCGAPAPLILAGGSNSSVMRMSLKIFREPPAVINNNVSTNVDPIQPSKN